MRVGAGGRAAMAVACLLVSACAKPPDTGSASGTVRVGVVAPRDQGARAQVVGLGYLTAALVRESLVAIGANGDFQPRLAERWERLDEGRRWRFHLKRGVKFHDGTPLDSDRVMRAIREQPSPISGLASVEKIDGWTFDILQDRASSFLLDGLAGVTVGADGRAGPGTGAFMASQQQGEQAMFRSFGQHHRGRPEIDEVRLQPFSDQRKAWAALMRSEVDVLYEVSPEARDFVGTENTVSVSAFVRPYTYLLGFDLADPAFKNKAIRRALNLAIDRKEVIRTALRGHAEPAYDHLWPRHWAVDPSRSAYEPNRAEALRLLESAGLTTLRQASPDRMPSRLTFTCLVYDQLEKFALAVQRQLALIDVDMQVVLLPAPQLGQRIATGDYDAFLFELANARVLGYTYLFWHSQSPASVRTGYAAADGALDRVRYAQAENDVRAAVREVQDVMRDDPPAIFLAYPEVARAVSRRFALPSGDEDIFHTISRWKPATRGSN